MPQYQTWENEYKKPLLVTGTGKPQLDFKHFVKWLKKDQKVDLEGLRVLDLGSGIGKNAIFLSERGSVVTGVELSDTATRKAKERAEDQGVEVEFIKGNIGELLPFEDSEFDLVLDVVSSNSLNETEMEVYLRETHRVLKPGGYLFVKALCKDGDKNAANLLQKFPGNEKDTYTMPGTGIVERVFSENDVRRLYGQWFKFLHLARKSSYTIFQGISYKRYFWLLYLQKR